MIEPMLSADGASVVIIAPHPDDESIAAGGLIQVALNHGARVTVVLLTDGDNNPWPQRVMERRIWIGVRERERWGRRRRDEARSALAIFGLPAGAIRNFGLLDLGVTSSLTNDTKATVARLCDTFREVAPTLVVAPSLTDRHPDHSAAHVMCCLALAACKSSAQLLSYAVHGTVGTPWVECRLDLQARERKDRAISAYGTQLTLSRRRMTAYSARPERYVVETASDGAAIATVSQLPWRVTRLSAALAEVTLLADTRSWRIAIERANKIPGNSEQPRCIRRSDGRVSLLIPAPLRLSAPAFAKLEGRLGSPWIYDLWGWTRLSPH